MRVQNKTTNRKTPLIILLIVAVVGLVALGYILIAKPFDRDTDNSSNSTSNQQTDDTPAGNNDSNTPPTTDSDSGTEQPQTDTPPQQSSTATINIPSYQATGGTISVNVAISEAWDTSAQCTMEITGAAKLTVTENVFAQAQISGCLLEASDLPSGSYTVSIYAENNKERTNTKVLRVAL